MEAKQVLTGISYYQYHFVASLAFGGYSIYHLMYGNSYISATLAAAAILILVLIARHALGKETKILHEAILITIIAAVYSACYFLGIRGIAWLFPLVLGVFFTYSNRNALVISALSVLGGLGFATHSVDQALVIRMFFPLAFTVAFAYLYGITIEKDRLALHKEANEDYLTGIWNRRSFQSWLQRTIPLHRNSKEFLAIFYLDIDNFKTINDTYGHEMGDRILQEVASRLLDSIRATDAVSRSENSKFARIAGDEFVIAVANLEFEQHASVIADRLLASVNAPFELDSVEFKLSTSIGVALSQNDEVSADDLLSEADAAMYRSKETGKNRITYFNDDIAKNIAEKKTIARGIEKAIQNEEFVLNFMPIFGSGDDKALSLAGAEVLISCHSDSLAGFGPDQYIPVAEEFGLIKDIDLYVIEKAFQTISGVLDKLPSDFILAINISIKELHNDEFPRQIQEFALENHIPPGLVELEIAETSLVLNDEKSIEVLNRIKAMGFHLSIDDFGTGYTAFSQLQNYPVDTLKIDTSFVWSISNEHNKQETMVDVILSLAKLYNVKIVAEGVENQTQLDYLTQAKCDYFQGFYLSKPLPWNAFVNDFLKPSD
jgi:diguanylate cyclase (GGDEF)-like protein